LPFVNGIHGAREIVSINFRSPSRLLASAKLLTQTGEIQSRISTVGSM
jgi:hypothetical protein